MEQLLRLSILKCLLSDGSSRHRIAILQPRGARSWRFPSHRQEHSCRQFAANRTVEIQQLRSSSRQFRTGSFIHVSQLYACTRGEGAVRYPVCKCVYPKEWSAHVGEPRQCQVIIGSRNTGDVFQLNSHEVWPEPVTRVAPTLGRISTAGPSPLSRS